MLIRVQRVDDALYKYLPGTIVGNVSSNQVTAIVREGDFGGIADVVENLIVSVHLTTLKTK